jgi:hypothetical protein
MTTTIIKTIEIPLDEFARYNRSMLKLLHTLYIDGSSLPTKVLYAHAHKSNNYSRLWLLKAERMGYITRKKVPMPKGKKGNTMVINTLTPKGRKLLSSLDLI